MNGAARVTYTGRPGTTKEAELSVLVNVYAFVIKRSRGTERDVGSKGSDSDEKQERR